PLHRACGDEHLGNEEVAALEPRSDFLERRDERVVEHLLGLELVLEPLVDEIPHFGRVADEGVVVEALQDLFVGHAAPRSWSRLSSRRPSVAACSRRSGASRSIRSGVNRDVGPEIESAATTPPAAARTGAAI